MKTSTIRFCQSVIIIIVLFSSQVLYGQWMQDFRQQMEIPGTINLHSSETHMYVLSEDEGLVVFRTHSDSLQWLYSSTGMQQRGHILESDIRFAYLYGNSRRLTVIEPTSVLGVYSSTVLPAAPRSVKRIEDNLYIALGNRGLGTLSLVSPESVDSEVEFIDQNRFRNSDVTSLATDQNQILYVLSGSDKIDIYESGSQSTLTHRERVEVNRSIQKLFLEENELYGSDNRGNIYRITSDGLTQTVANVSGSVQKLKIWNNNLVVHTDRNELWIGPARGNPERWKTNERAGNYFTVTENKLWVSESSQISPVVESTAQNNSNRSTAQSVSSLKLKAIDDIVLPFPRPLILPVELENRISGAEVTFTYSAPFNNARLRGNTLYWQPTATQTGRHRVEITASTSDGQTDQVEFFLDLRSFNAPPRFSPGRPVTIPIRETFQLDINAVDPDGMNSSLIRYLGVDMPEGARLNEKSGVFTWTPNIRQVGNHTFQVIATDQYGAASSQNFEIRVVEVHGEDSTGDQK